MAKAYYWHRFYSHQPDLNFDNPEVRGDVLKLLDFWLEMGVDGLRLDAVPYLFEREGTNCENLPETHAFLKELRRHVDEKYPRPHAAGRGQSVAGGCGRLFRRWRRMPHEFPFSADAAAVHGGASGKTGCRSSIFWNRRRRLPDKCQWAIFLRNHDELTLEMVTDEERDYMYRAYAADPQVRDSTSAFAAGWRRY